ncbi:MFS transporter [Corynebacterium pacaense]|uniref:MFS transporter n=1 Tax=Corynebacterium pacaense TaxID=1816684 RepID=UPI0009BA8400|nr:MFS transporter [Corynebacterium pacaense]
MRYPRFTALTAIALTSLNLRTAVTALSPLVPEIQRSIGVSASMVGVLGMIPTAMFAIAAFVLPGFKRRLTTSQLLLIAMLLTAAGQLLRVSAGPVMLLGGSVAALFAIGVTNALLPLAVREYFPNHISSMSIGYLISSQITMALSPILAVPISVWAERTGLSGWRVSLGSWALLGLLAAMAWIPLLGHRGENPDVKTPEPSMGVPVWRTPVGVGLGLMFGFTSFVTYSMMAFLPQMVPDPQLGAALLGWWSILGLPLNIIGPWVVDRVADSFPFVLLAAVLMIIGNAGLCLAPMTAPWVWTTLAGLGPLAFPMALTLINIRARTPEGATALSSFGQGLGYSVACLGPLLTGITLQLTGGFRAVLAVFVTATVIVIAGSFFATRPVFVEDQARGRGKGI